MKKLFLTLLTGLGALTMTAQTNTPTPGNTQSNNSVQAPNNINSRFNTDYPNMNPTWTMDGQNYRADYGTGTSGRSITYDRSGNVMSRDEQMSSGSYPSGISDYYTQTYPNEQYDVWSSTDASGSQTYYTNRNSEKLMFDKSGKYKSRSKSTTKTNTSRKK